MADLNKLSAQESLNLEAGLNWSANTVSVDADATLSIEVTGYNKILFYFDNSPGKLNRFKFSTNSSETMATSDTDHMVLTTGVTYELPIPAMMDGERRERSDSLYLHILDESGAENNINYNLS